MVSSIQAVNSGSVVLGMLLTRTTGCAAGLLGVPFVLAASLLGVGLLFFSALFLRDDPTSFAGFDLRGASEEEVPSKEIGAEPPGEEAEPGEREEGVFLRFMEQGLSLQEIRVALLVDEGLSNADISQRLNITSNTLRSHLRKIHKKIGSSSRKSLREELQRMRGDA